MEGVWYCRGHAYPGRAHAVIVGVAGPVVVCSKQPIGSNGDWVADAPWEEVTCQRCLRAIRISELGAAGLPVKPPAKSRRPTADGHWEGELLTVSYADVRSLEILKGLNLGQPLPQGFFVVASADRRGEAIMRVLDYRRRPDLAEGIRQVARRRRSSTP